MLRINLKRTNLSLINSARLTFLSASFILLTIFAAVPSVRAAGGPTCSLPGVTIFTDPSGDAVDGLGAHDLQSFSIAEPSNLTDQSVFTIKVADLSILPPNTEWMVDWRNYFGMTFYFIAMDTFDPLRGPVFTYGHYQCSPSLCQRITDGYADAGEYLPDGTIRITVANSKLGNQPGQIIGTINAGIRPYHAMTFGLPGDIDGHWGGVAEYTFVGNAACNEVILPPAAPTGLTATSLNNSGAKKSLVMLLWNDNADNEQAYHIERSTSAAGGFVEIASATANATSYEDRTVQSRTTYYYRIRASNPGGYSVYSNVASVNVK